MPSSKGYKRDHAQERKAHLENGGLEKDRKKAQAQRNAKKAGIRKTGDGKDTGHKKSMKSGGSSKAKNLKSQSKASNRSHGGKTGSKAGKAAGARKGHSSRRK